LRYIRGIITEEFLLIKVDKNDFYDIIKYLIFKEEK